MAQSLDYVKRITRFGLGSQVGRLCVAMANARDQNTSGNRTFERLRAAGGEMSLHSKQGQWFQRMANTIDGQAVSQSTTLGLLKASGGEMQRSSALGQFEDDLSHA